MNVYDFDGTVYDGDSSFDFFFFSLRRHPSIFLRLPAFAAAFFRYKAKKHDKTAMKQVFFSFVKKVPDIQSEVKAFWDKNEKKIYGWYIGQKREDDLIISASPEFLLGDICARLGIREPIASRVDEKSGGFDGKNCHDREKVVRFAAKFPDAKIERFYSDSRSDSPLAALADEPFFIEKGKPVPWGAVEEYLGD